MKNKILFLLFVPFFSFGITSSDVVPNSVRVYTFDYVSSLNDYSTSFSQMSFSGEDPFLVYSSTTFGLVFASNHIISLPGSNLSSSTNSAFDVNFPIRCNLVDSNSRVFVSPFLWPSCQRLFHLCVNLYLNGYRGPGAVAVNTKVSPLAVNFNFPVLVSDVLSSTNTAFRQLLLSNLSSIQSSVINIDSGVSALAPEVSNIRSINTGILTNVQNTAAYVGSIDEAVDLLVDRVGEVLDKINSDPYVSDFTNAVLALAEINGSFTPSYVDHLLSSYAGLDSPIAKALFALSVKQDVDSGVSAEEFIKTAAGMPTELVTIGQYISHDVVDALIGDYSDSPTRGSKAVNNRTSIKAQLRSWRDEAKQQLQDWKYDLRQQLQDWKTSDETGYLNVRGGIDNVATNQVRYWDKDSPDSAVNYGVRNLTNAADRIVRDSSLAITNAIKDLRDFFDRNLFGSDSPGANVRITFPLRYESSKEVNVHDQEVADAIRDGYINIQELKSAILEALNTSDPSVHIKGTNSIDWVPWFEKWDPYSATVTNYYSEYNSSDPVADVADRFLTGGFDIDEYNELPWFSRVEVLLAMIADISTSSNSVEVADIEDELGGLVDDFNDLGTNVVSSSSAFVGLFDYLKRTAERFKSVFGDHSAPVTDGGVILLSSGNWIGNEPLVLKIDITVQNVMRLFFRCFWLLSALVVLWLVVSWSWQKVLAVLRWLWSMFDL